MRIGPPPSGESESELVCKFGFIDAEVVALGIRVSSLWTNYLGRLTASVKEYEDLEGEGERRHTNLQRPGYPVYRHQRSFFRPSSRSGLFSQHDEKYGCFPRQRHSLRDSVSRTAELEPISIDFKVSRDDTTLAARTEARKWPVGWGVCLGTRAESR